MLINDSNHKEIIKTMRSVFLCLHVLLINPTLRLKLAEYGPEIDALKSHDFIIHNIHAILTHDKYANYRQQALFFTGTNSSFELGLELVNSLKPSAKITTDLINSIIESDLEFMQQLDSIIKSDLKANTKQHCYDLISILTDPNAAQNIMSRQTQTQTNLEYECYSTCNASGNEYGSYCEQTYNYSCDEDPPPNNSYYCASDDEAEPNAICTDCIQFGVRAGTRNAIKKAQTLFWSFKAKIESCMSKASSNDKPCKFSTMPTEHKRNHSKAVVST